MKMMTPPLINHCYRHKSASMPHMSCDSIGHLLGFLMQTVCIRGPIHAAIHKLCASVALERCLKRHDRKTLMARVVAEAEILIGVTAAAFTAYPLALHCHRTRLESLCGVRF